MGWNEVDLSKVNPNLDPISEGFHTFEIIKAYFSPRDPNEITLQTAITEGDFAGRICFPTYPDPEKFDWAPKALKRLESAIGIECEDGEDKVSWLNRCAGSRFRMKVGHTSKVPEGSDKPTIYVKYLTFTTEPAA